MAGKQKKPLEWGTVEIIKLKKLQIWISKIFFSFTMSKFFLLCFKCKKMCLRLDTKVLKCVECHWLFHYLWWNHFQYGLSVSRFSFSLNTIIPWCKSYKGPHRELSNPLFSQMNKLRSSWISGSKSPTIIVQCSSHYVLSTALPPITTAKSLHAKMEPFYALAPPGWLYIQTS